MTRRYYLNGVELTSVTVTGRPRQDELDGLVSSAFGGDIGTSGIIIDDPTGSVTIAGHQPFYVEEDSCTPPRLWTGYIGGRIISRGDLYEGGTVGRRWDCTLMDLNFLLGLRVFRDHADDKRPQETDAARVAWMLTTPAMTDAGPGIFDNGFVSATATHVYDPADLFGEFPDQSLNSIMAGSKTYFVYWDAAAASGEEASLFYGEHAVGFGNLSVKLSNVRADIDDSNPATQTTFAVHDAEQVDRNPQAVEDGLLYRFLGGQAIYRQLASTFTAFGIHRDGVLESDRVGKLATAEGQASLYLAQHAAERDTIHCTVRLRKEQLNWFREGWRVQAKFSHLPGYTSFTYVMIEKRSVALAPGAFDLYDVSLELTSSAPLGGGPGGGSPDDFPHVGCTPTTGSFVQKNTGTSLISGIYYAVMPAPTTVGNTLIRYAPKRNVPAGPGEVGIDPAWVLTPPGVFVNQTSGAKVWYRPVTVAETNVSIQPDLNSNDVVIELEGPLTLVDYAMANDTTTHVICASVTPTPGSNAVILGIVNGYISPGTATNNNFTPDAGWTELFDDSDGAGAPNSTIVYKHVSSASGSYSPSTVMAFPSTFVWNAQSLAFVCAASSNPPSPAQRFGPVTPLETPDGATFTFTLPVGKEFADGSIEVFVDRLDQTAAVTSYDGAARTFTLSFAPWGTDTIEVYGQGR